MAANLEQIVEDLSQLGRCHSRRGLVAQIPCGSLAHVSAAVGLWVRSESRRVVGWR